MEFDSSQITVKVDSPELKNQLAGASKYYLYQIHGKDKFSTFSVSRRYSDFIVLKTSMMTRWPGVYIPPLPQKKFIGNNDTEFVDYRRNGLQQFLCLISKVNFLWYGDQFQLFIKSNTGEVEKSLNNLGKSNFKEIAIKYETTFAEKFEKIQAGVQCSQKIIEFKTYIKNSQMLLEKMNKVSESMTQTRRKFQEKYTNFLTAFLPDYQEKCISQYLPSQQEVSFHLYFNRNSELNLTEEVCALTKTFGTHGKFTPTEHQNLQYKHNSLSLVNQLIKQQLRELQNFNEIILTKQSYDGFKFRSVGQVKDLELQETKIIAGNQSLVNKFKTQNKEEQLKNHKIQLEKARLKQKEIENVCKVIEMVLAEGQINRFKEERTKNYYKVVKMIATAQREMYEAEGKLWNKIAGFQEKEQASSPLKQEKEIATKIQTEIKMPVTDQKQVAQVPKIIEAQSQNIQVEGSQNIEGYQSKQQTQEKSLDIPPEQHQQTDSPHKQETKTDKKEDEPKQSEEKLQDQSEQS